MKPTSRSGTLQTIEYIIMVVIYCYLERENYKVLKCENYNSSYFKIRASLF